MQFCRLSLCFFSVADFHIPKFTIWTVLSIQPGGDSGVPHPSERSCLDLLEKQSLDMFHIVLLYHFYYPVVRRERFGARCMNTIPHIFPIQWGAVRSYLDFPNHLIVYSPYVDGWYSVEIPFISHHWMNYDSLS